MVTETTLALLVGGRGQRMGQDKGLLSLRGKPLVFRQILRLGPLFKHILIICSSGEQKKQVEKLPIEIKLEKKDSLQNIEKQKNKLTNKLTKKVEEKILDLAVASKTKKTKEKRTILYLTSGNILQENKRPEKHKKFSSMKRINLLKILRAKFTSTKILVEKCGYKNEESLYDAIHDINLEVAKMMKRKFNLIIGEANFGYRIAPGYKISYH